MFYTMTSQQPVSAAYRALISRIADDEPNSGWPADVDLLACAGPLSDEELALVCDMHAQAVTDEFSLDPTLIARYLRREIDSNQLLNQLRAATERAVCQTLREDVLAECESRAELAREHQLEDYYGGSTMTAYERLAFDHGVARLFK